MLSIADSRDGASRFCDGMHRRNFLKMGGLAMGGLSLSGLLQAEAVSGINSAKNSHKAIIMVLMPGGPPHQDMYDLKPDAPAEIRGEFNPISTSVSGIQICELLPRIAKMMDDFVVIRSLTDCFDQHNLHQCLTGWDSHPAMRDSPAIPGYPQGGWPSLSAVVSKLQGSVNQAVPPAVSLAPAGIVDILRAPVGLTGYLGPSYTAFEPNEGSESDFVLNGVTLDRLANRKALLSSFDRFRRQADASGLMAGMDVFSRQAFGVLTSQKMAEALDLTREDPAVLKRYGVDLKAEKKHGGPHHLNQFVLARRMVQAGARVVTVTFARYPLGRMLQGAFNWDWHRDNFPNARGALPIFDQGITALVDDLKAHDMLDDVTVCAWGEFGRTPRINPVGGRDHWPAASCALLAGGGMRTGQVIGATNRLAERPTERPVYMREVFATLYRNIGIDTKATQLIDLNGRPHFLVDRDPLPEVI